MSQTLLLDIGKLLLGILILVYSGDMLVKGSVALANHFKISSLVIGLTIVAFGNRIPKLTASVIAAFKKETNISVVNIIGSNIFNVFVVIGITAGIQPIFLRFQEFRIDLNFMMIFFVLLFIFILPVKWMVGKQSSTSGTLIERYKKIEGKNISRTKGFILFALYVTYIFLNFKS